ncbi:hypothetical protein BV25DRAFT_1913248 [Artomyces pyxidatus]|uniref:Uncharacterized protein n=1 Tax=Artomyces pyxidatus TaxID=48021 RepID=A0ACB8TCG9_9AGAM|nr:hypothetical protein BV25DRAFT_1913248 [Artomyces pyxidatus]
MLWLSYGIVSMILMSPESKRLAEPDFVVMLVVIALQLGVIFCVAQIIVFTDSPALEEVRYYFWEFFGTQGRFWSFVLAPLQAIIRRVHSPHVPHATTDDSPSEEWIEVESMDFHILINLTRRPDPFDAYVVDQ